MALIPAFYYRETETDVFQSIITTNYKESIDPHFFTFDNKNIYASSNLGRDKKAIVIFDIETGKETEKLYTAMLNMMLLGYTIHEKKTLTTIAYTTWKRKQVFLDDEVKKFVLKT